MMQNPEKSLKPWQMSTHLRTQQELSNEYQHDRVQIRFSRILASLCFGRKQPQHWKGSSQSFNRCIFTNTVCFECTIDICKNAVTCFCVHFWTCLTIKMFLNYPYSSCIHLEITHPFSVGVFIVIISPASLDSLTTTQDIKRSNYTVIYTRNVHPVMDKYHLG